MVHSVVFVNVRKADCERDLKRVRRECDSCSRDLSIDPVASAVCADASAWVRPNCISTLDDEKDLKCLHVNVLEMFAGESALLFCKQRV